MALLIFPQMVTFCLWPWRTVGAECLQSLIVKEELGLIGIFGSAKTDPVWFEWGFGEGLLKDKFAFCEAYKSPTPKRRKLLAKRPFL